MIYISKTGKIQSATPAIEYANEPLLPIPNTVSIPLENCLRLTDNGYLLSKNKTD